MWEIESGGGEIRIIALCRAQAEAIRQKEAEADRGDVSMFPPNLNFINGKKIFTIKI